VRDTCHGRGLTPFERDGRLVRTELES